jgi:hypothetical protein
MTLQKKAFEMAAFGKLLGTFNATSEERKTFLQGCSILLDLDWPSNYIDAKKCQRAIEGLVPRYENITSQFEYEARWYPESHSLGRATVSPDG